jgi:hypothetical protein
MWGRSVRKPVVVEMQLATSGGGSGALPRRHLWPAQTGIQQGFIKTSIEINNRYRSNKQAVLGLVRVKPYMRICY